MIRSIFSLRIIGFSLVLASLGIMTSTVQAIVYPLGAPPGEIVG